MRPAWSLDRSPGEIDRHHDRANSGGRAEQAEAPRADVEDVAGIGRQQRYGAAEEHGEEVEGDGAENDLLVPDVAEAGDDCHHVAGSDMVFCVGRGTSATRTAAAANRTKATP